MKKYIRPCIITELFSEKEVMAGSGMEFGEEVDNGTFWD